MNVFTSRENRRRAIALLVVGALALVVTYLALREYAPFLFDATELRAWIEQFGVLGPLVFVLLQLVQVVVAPVPGQVAALVAGYLFGPLYGTVYSMIGVVAGSAIAFSLSKHYGRPAVERLVHQDLVTRFDGFVEAVGLPGLFVFVVIPGLPDDAVCFLAGLTRFRLRTFLVVIALGRLPAYVITVYAGGRLATGHLLQATIALAVVVSLSALGYYKMDDIKEFLSKV